MDANSEYAKLARAYVKAKMKQPARGAMAVEYILANPVKKEAEDGDKNKDQRRAGTSAR